MPDGTTGASAPAVKQLSNDSLEDLGKSGLAPEDIRIRPAKSLELSTIGMPSSADGYVIPYYDISGAPKPFYRVRLFNHLVKYKQPKDTPSHVYFPPMFMKLLRKMTSNKNQHPRPYIVLCEGEKKAACASVHAGIPTAAFGGVDSWRTRKILIDDESELNKVTTSTGEQLLAVTLKKGDEAKDSGDLKFAEGFNDLVQLLVDEQLDVVIIYDSDSTGIQFGTKSEVQRAAFSLAAHLRYKGLAFNRIHQAVLPKIDGSDEKVGLDDYLLAKSPDALRELCEEAIEIGRFPRHPNVKEYVNKELGGKRRSRENTHRVSYAVLSDLDATGTRLLSPAMEDTYYFDTESRKLLKAQFAGNSNGVLPATSEWAGFLYRRYGLTNTDVSFLQVLSAQFAHEQPIQKVDPNRIFARPRPGEDILRMQINDGQYVKVSSDPENPIDILDNGSEGHLFVSDQVEATDAGDLLEAIEAEFEEIRNNGGVMRCKWREVIGNTRLKNKESLQDIVSLLYYMSPWLFRWRNTQLPVELVSGEAGSGKSSLYELRQEIMTGRIEMRPCPNDIRDWQSSIANAGGLHVIDNVHITNRDLRQKLSDEMCRVITASKPKIKARKLYANMEEVSIDVNTIFAMTSISNPFNQVDLLARSIAITLDKTLATNVDRGDGSDQEETSTKDGAGNKVISTGRSIRYQSYWVESQLEDFGGRVRWLAHHLVALHMFFTKAQESWDTMYDSKYRLVNFEQSMRIMAKVFGLPDNEIPDRLNNLTHEVTSDADWTLDGLSTFAEYINEAPHLHGTIFTAAEISEWAQANEEFEECLQLTSPNRLSRYIAQNAYMVASRTGIIKLPKKDGRSQYEVKIRGVE